MPTSTYHRQHAKYYTGKGLRHLLQKKREKSFANLAYSVQIGQASVLKVRFQSKHNFRLDHHPTRRERPPAKCDAEKFILDKSYYVYTMSLSLTIGRQRAAVISDQV